MPANTLIEGLKEAIVVAERKKYEDVDSLISALKNHLKSVEEYETKLGKLWGAYDLLGDDNGAY